ncbi:MAG: hypothetical protein ACJA09_000424 [Alcanivorax sp.]
MELLKQRQDEVGVTQAGGEEKPPHY